VVPPPGAQTAPALSAVLGVPPATEQARPLRIEDHGEGLGVGRYLERMVGAPIRGHLKMALVASGEQTTEHHPIGVEVPGAVTRLEDQWFHDYIIDLQPGNGLAEVLHFDDNVFTWRAMRGSAL
jgi:hypothetical protein